MADNKPQKPETNEIATLEKDIDLFSGYLTNLPNPDKVLRLECGGDIRVYDDIGRDARVASVLRTRSLAVIGREWEIVPASDDAQDGRIADYVKQAFLAFPFDLARRAILRGGVLKGYAVSEIMWEVSEGDVWINAMKPRAQRRFVFDMDENLRLLTRDDMIFGQNLTAQYPRKFQRFTFGDEPETPYGVGLGRELYWPWWFKKNDIKFWLTFCDKFGGPTSVGKYPSGTSKGDQDKLLDAAAAIQNEAAVIIPEGMSLELLEAARSGSIDTYESLAAFMNDEITISVLGQSGTTQGTPGKLGDEESQENVRLDLVKADADALCEALNPQVIRWLVDYNFPGHGRYPKMWIRCDKEENLKAKAERDEILSRLVPIPHRYVYETYGIPAPEKGEAATAPQQGTSGPAPGVEFSEPGQAAGDWSEKALDAADGSDMVTAVYRLLDDADSLEAVRDQLLNLYDQLPQDKVGEVLAQALTCADLQGRLDVKEGQ